MSNEKNTNQFRRSAMLVHSISVALTIVANVAIATGPAVLCVNFFLLHAILEFRCRWQTLRNGEQYFTHAIQKVYSLKAN